MAAPEVTITRKYDRDYDWYAVHVEFVRDGWLVTRPAGGSQTRAGAEKLGADYAKQIEADDR